MQALGDGDSAAVSLDTREIIAAMKAAVAQVSDVLQVRVYAVCLSGCVLQGDCTA